MSEGRGMESNQGMPGSSSPTVRPLLLLFLPPDTLFLFIYFANS